MAGGGEKIPIMVLGRFIYLFKGFVPHSYSPIMGCPGALIIFINMQSSKSEKEQLD